MADHKNTENSVLDVYRRVNPSQRPVEQDSKLFEYIRKMRENLFFLRLKLPKTLFKGANLVSFGCGTGEYELFYAMWGCKGLTCIDMNGISINRLRSLFQHYNLEHTLKKTYAESYFDVDLSTEQFDFVIADGTIVHTEDPLGALERFLSYIAPGGFIIVSFAELAGMIQRNLQRIILYTLAGTNESKIEEYAMLLFKEHIERSIQFGKRTKEQIIYDSYINPKIKTPMLQDIFDVFSKHDITFYSSYPPISSPFLTTSFRDNVTPLENHRFYHMILLNQICWLLAADDDLSVSQQDFASWISQREDFAGFLVHLYDVIPQEEQIQRLERAFDKLRQFSAGNFCGSLNQFLEHRVREFALDLEELLEALKRKDVEKLAHVKYRRLFKGTCGIGTMYIVGHKREMD